jgi:hypothetical protein
MGICASVGFLHPLSAIQWLLTRLDLKSENGGRLLSQRHTISWDTRRCIPSTVSLTKSASD